MNDKVMQLSGKGKSMKMSVLSSWSTQAADSSDKKFLRSWFVYDSGLEDDKSARWRHSRLPGFVLALLIGAGFWAGLALLVARVWK